MEDLASSPPPCSHKRSPHCGTDMAHSHDFFHTSWRTRIISTQHSVNIHWENELQFIVAVPQPCYTGSAADPQLLLFVLELLILWRPKWKPCVVKEPTQLLLSIIHVLCTLISIQGHEEAEATNTWCLHMTPSQSWKLETENLYSNFFQNIELVQ